MKFHFNLLRGIITTMILGITSVVTWANEAHHGSFSCDIKDGRRVTITDINKDINKIT